MVHFIRKIILLSVSVKYAAFTRKTADGRYFAGTAPEGKAELTAQGISLTMMEKILALAGSQSRC